MRTFYIDQKGYKWDSLTGLSPYYQITREWQLKNSALSHKTMSIDGENIMVAFEEEASRYVDDPVIRKMIENQITFELAYQDKQANYSHAEFIKNLMQRGMIVIKNVIEPQDFSFDMITKHNGAQAGSKALTKFDKITNKTTIFNQEVKLAADENIIQNKQIGKSFVIKNDEILAIDIKQTTDSMSTVNWSVINVTTGEVVEEWVNAESGFRYIFIPGKKAINHTYKVVINSEQSGTADILMFKYNNVN